MATQDGPLDDRQPRSKDREASVAGSLSDMGVADLVQTLELGRKSGVLHLKAGTGARATCHFRNGRVVDCELGAELQGEEAFYRILRWNQGGFAIEFKPVEREERIQLPTQALLLQGMRRIDEWEHAVEQLPPLDRTLEVDVARLGDRLAKVPDGANALLRLFDGRRTLAQVIEVAPGQDRASADTIARLIADGILTDAGAAAPRAAIATPPELGVPAAAPGPGAPAPEQGGVDWFAGPVGPEAVIAPASSWMVTPGEAGAPRTGLPPSEGDWLEPPLTAPPAAAPPVATATATRASPPRPAVRFSIPVPPPGTLPPPPSVAETLARYRVPPRSTAPAAPAPAAAASTPAPAASVPELVAPVPDRVAAEPDQAAPAPERSAPVAAPPSEARPAARAAGRSIRERLEPGSLPLHLEAPPEASRPPAAPRRSAVPYLAIGALVIAAIAAGTVLLRRPSLDARKPASAPAPEEARVDPAPAPAPADVPRQAPAAAPAEVAASPAAPAVEPSASPSRADPPAVAALPAAAAAAPQPKVEPAPKAEVEDAARLLATADQRYAAGRYAEAITAYRRAIALEPTAAARVALARALYDAHRDAEAMRELDRVIGANPREASAWLLRGDIHQGEGRSDKAREAYQRYLEIEPDGEQARVVRTILGRDP